MKIEKTTTISLATGVLGLTGHTDGSRLYAACMDGRVFEINPATKAVTPFATAHASYASGCVLLPDGGTVISGGYDGGLLWHDVATKGLIRRANWATIFRVQTFPGGFPNASSTNLAGPIV